MLKLDRNGRNILKVLMTDPELIFICHVSEYLAGRLRLHVSTVSSQLEAFEQQGLITWIEVEDGRQVQVNNSLVTESNLLKEQIFHARMNVILMWVWPIVTAIISCAVTYWLSKK